MDKSALKIIDLQNQLRDIDKINERIIREINSFDHYCAAVEHTDIHEAWDVFYWIRSMLEGTVEEDSKPELDIHFREQKIPPF